MRTSSMVLSIISASLAILTGLFLLLFGMIFLYAGSFQTDYDSYYYSTTAADASSIGGGFITLLGVFGLIGGIMGLVAGIIVKKKNVAAGVMMFIAAAFSFLECVNIVSMILFIISGVFAFVNDYQQQAALPPQQPMIQNAPQQPMVNNMPQQPMNQNTPA